MNTDPKGYGDGLDELPALRDKAAEGGPAETEELTPGQVFAIRRLAVRAGLMAERSPAPEGCVRITVDFDVQATSEVDDVEAATYLDGALDYMLEVSDDASRIRSYSIRKGVAP